MANISAGSWNLDFTHDQYKMKRFFKIVEKGLCVVSTNKPK